MSLLLFRPLFNHSCHKNSKLHENTDSRSVLPFNYTTTLTARVLDSDLGSGLSAEAASIFPHGPRSLRVHCGCCKSFSYSWLTPTICPGAHLTNFNFRWACLCACVGVCVPARVHREHQHCVHPTSERAWRGEMERERLPCPYKVVSEFPRITLCYSVFLFPARLDRTIWSQH